jgi:hypothetical protein
MIRSSVVICEERNNARGMAIKDGFHTRIKGPRHKFGAKYQRQTQFSKIPFSRDGVSQEWGSGYGFGNPCL